MCPECGGELQGHYQSHREAHGEDVSEHWLECVKCHSKMDPGELKQVCDYGGCKGIPFRNCDFCGDEVCPLHYSMVYSMCLRCCHDKFERGQV